MGGRGGGVGGSRNVCTPWLEYRRGMAKNLAVHLIRAFKKGGLNITGELERDQTGWRREEQGPF